MSKQDRATLKSYFRKGALPTAEHYRDLIDSSVNQIEDGFDKTNAEGLAISSTGGAHRLVSLYEGAGATDPSWVMEHGDRGDGTLHLSPGLARQGETETTSTLSLHPSGYVGIGQPEPAHALDVAGAVRMSARLGVPSAQIPHVPADARWHTITPSLTGCQILEVVAGTGGVPGHGRYALLHAVAMNAYNPRNWMMNWVFARRSIRAQTAVYGSYADRLRLRWIPDRERAHHYFLQIRTNARFGPDRLIRYTITALWLDPLMQTAAVSKESDGADAQNASAGQDD